MKPEVVRRYLLGAVALPVLLLLTGGAVVWGPWSPLALDQADAAYASGDFSGARAAYAAVAEGWHRPSTRAAAALRVGLLADQQGDHRDAAEWLRRAADLEPEPDKRAQVWVQLAVLYLDHFSEPVRAAEAYEMAARTGDDPRHLLAAARLWERARKPDRALADYREAAAKLGAIDNDAWQAAQADVARLSGDVTADADAEGAAAEGAAEPGDM